MSSSFFHGVYFGLVIVASFVRVVYTREYGAHRSGFSTAVEVFLERGFGRASTVRNTHEPPGGLEPPGG